MIGGENYRSESRLSRRVRFQDEEAASFSRGNSFASSIGDIGTTVVPAQKHAGRLRAWSPLDKSSTDSEDYIHPPEPPEKPAKTKRRIRITRQPWVPPAYFRVRSFVSGGENGGIKSAVLTKVKAPRIRRSQSQDPISVQQTRPDSWPGGLGYRGDEYIFPAEVHQLAAENERRQFQLVKLANVKPLVKINYKTAVQSFRLRTLPKNGGKNAIDENDLPISLLIDKAPEKPYHKIAIRLATGSMSSAISTSSVLLILYGEDGVSPTITLSSHRLAFFSGTVEDFQATIPDLGEWIYNLSIRISATGVYPDWLCEYVELVQESEPISWRRMRFLCRRWLNHETPQLLLSPDVPFELHLNPVGLILRYEITVKTGDAWNATTGGRVFLTIHGENGESGRIELSASSTKNRLKEQEQLFQKNSTSVFLVEVKDRHSPLGEISWIRLEHVPKQIGVGWYLEHVIIAEKDADGATVSDRKYFFSACEWLKSEKTPKGERNAQAANDRHLALDVRATSIASYLRFQDEELWPLEKWKFQNDSQVVFYSCSSQKALRISSGGFIDAKATEDDLLNGNAVFSVRDPSVPETEPDFVIGLYTALAERPFCIAFTDKAITSEDPESFHDACDVRIRCLPDRYVMLESFKFPGCYLCVTSHGQLYLGTELGFPPQADYKFACYAKGCFRDYGIVQLCTSQTQALSLYRGGFTLWALGKRDEFVTVHKVGDDNIRKFESMAYPGNFLQVKKGSVDCSGLGDRDCEFWVRRNRHAAFVVLEPFHEEGVIGFTATGDVCIYQDLTSYVNCRLYPQIVKVGYPKAHRPQKLPGDEVEEFEIEDLEFQEVPAEGPTARFQEALQRKTDSQELHEALEKKAIGDVTKALARRRYRNRLELSETYKEMFEKELYADILEAVPDGSQVGTILVRLAKPRPVVLAEDLDTLLKSTPADKDGLFDIIVTEPFEELYRTRDLYRKQNNLSLEKDLAVAIEGDSLMRQLLISLSARPKPPAGVSINASKLDARALYEEFYPRRRVPEAPPPAPPVEGDNKDAKKKKKVKKKPPKAPPKPKQVEPEDHFLFSLFKIRENNHLRSIFDWYKREFAVDVRDSITRTFPDQTVQQKLLAVVETVDDTPAHFVQRLKKAFDTKNSDQIIRILTLRCDFNDFGNIVEDFNDLVGGADDGLPNSLRKLYGNDEEALAALESLVNANKGRKVMTRKLILKQAAKRAAMKEEQARREAQREAGKKEKLEREAAEREEKRKAEEAELARKKAEEEEAERKRLADIIKPDHGTVESVPSIVALLDFDAKGNSQRVNKALTSFITDKKVLVEIFPTRSQEQRMELRKVYNEVFTKRDFDKDLDKNTSGDFGSLLKNIMRPHSDLSARRLKAMIDDKKSPLDVEAFIDIVFTESFERLQQIDEEYNQIFKQTLEDDITAKYEKTQARFASLIVGQLSRPHTPEQLSLEQLKVDASKLHDELTQQLLLEFLSTRGHSHFRAILNVYRNEYNQNFPAIITDASHLPIFDNAVIQKAFGSSVAAIENKWAYLARRLIALIQIKQKILFSHIITTRCEFDLQNVRQQFDTINVGTNKRAPLDKAIAAQLDSGDYGKVLTSLVVGNVPMNMATLQKQQQIPPQS